METHLEYKARILKLMEGQDPVAVQRATYPALASLVDGVSADALHHRPSPGSWSAAQIFAHLADAEITAFWRYRQMIQHDGGPLPGYDQDLWAELGQYASQDPRESLQKFQLVRESNLRMFDYLTAEQWQRNGIHLERGPMTVHDLATQIAGHDLNHLKQLHTILGK